MRSIHALTSSAIQLVPITVTQVPLSRRAADHLISTIGAHGCTGRRVGPAEGERDF
jgi:hypothetical protein